jgi:hypothetical protein
MKQNNRLTGRRIGAAAALAAVTTCGGVALAPAAFAQSTVASATTSSTAHSAAQSPAAHPATVNECYQVLQAYGYTVSVARAFACLVASSAPVNEAAKIASCVGLMKVAGVRLVIAATACTVATIPG